MSNLNDQKILEVDNQYWVDMNTALDRLHDNKDFQYVILQGYFKDKAIDGVSLLAQDSVVESGRRAAVMEDLIGVSSLQDHFITIMNLGAAPLDDDDEDDEE
jgi:hypothetical protein